MSLRRRDTNEDAPWSSTPSRGKATSEHAALTALSQSTATDRKSGAVDDVGSQPFSCFEDNGYRWSDPCYASDHTWACQPSWREPIQP